MPELSAQVLENIANQTLDYYFKNEILSQTIQDKPFLAAMRAAQKKFPGSKEFIRGNVKGTYTTEFMGYEGDDPVTYNNPTNVKQFAFPWFEHHAGIFFTNTELKRNGISVSNTMTGESTSRVSDSDLIMITDLLKDKLEDMDEGTARSLDSIFHRDGTQSAKVTPGLTALIADDPTTGVVGSIDRATNSWWRNRALVGGNKIVASTSAQTATKTLRTEVRQLRRYGGRPNLLIAGSSAFEALEAEIHEKGSYTESGFNKKIDIGIGEISIKGLGTIMYDPTLDDLGRSDYLYMIDTRHLYPMVMNGEDMRVHNPARPYDRYVFYRSVTWTGTMIVRKLNAHGVYQIQKP